MIPAKVAKKIANSYIDNNLNIDNIIRALNTETYISRLNSNYKHVIQDVIHILTKYNSKRKVDNE